MSELLKRSDEATAVAKAAFAAGDKVTGIAAISLAAQLVQLARLFEKTEKPRPPVSQDRRRG